MDDDAPGEEMAEWFRKCLCGKRFYQLNAYTNHINGCDKYKHNVGATLRDAKVRYKARKLNKGKGKGQRVVTSWYDEDDLDVDHVRPSPGPSRISHGDTPPGPPGTDSEGMAVDVYPRRDEAPPLPAEDTGTEPQPTLSPMEVDPPGPAPTLGRGHRVRRAVQRFKDYMATSTIPFDIPSTIPPETEQAAAPPPTDTDPAPPLAGEQSASPSQITRKTILDKCCWRATPCNHFGLYKKFWCIEQRPHDPDFYITSDDLREDDEELEQPIAGKDDPNPDPPPPMDLFPFPNWSSFRLGEWYWGDDSQEKGRESFQQLISILISDDFNTDEIRAANWEQINESLAESEFDKGTGYTFGTHWFGDGTSWQSASVQLEIPFNRTSLNPGVQYYEVPDFHYRSLVPVITERLKDARRGDHFHVVPSELRWQPQGSGGPDLRVYGELYNSPAFLEAYQDVQNLEPEPTEDALPRYIVALLFASDETMLASFGTSKLWPLYLMFGNESKHRRGKPSLKLFEEVAYFQSMPDEFQDWYLDRSGKKAVSNPLSTHLNRELFQKQWRILLDDEFVEAYAHGIIVDCFDGIRRRFYPRILGYAADYPERVAIVGIRNMGDHPCPRCLVALEDIHNMGTPDDMALRKENCRKDDYERRKKVEDARRIIHEQNYSVNTAEVERLLKPTSLVPTTNSFSDRLSSLGLDVYKLIVVDILHEVEIGVWKSLFIQLLRLLEATNKSTLNVLNARFRQMPTFGTDTIRRFRSNVSEMKQLAARDYEDILQCAMAAFEGLVPGEHGDRVQDLLFTFAYWHSLAKLKLHTDDTLALLDEWTVILGSRSRLFVEQTCAAFDTRELKREYESRKRAEARKKQSVGVAPTAASVANTEGKGKQPEGAVTAPQSQLGPTRNPDELGGPRSVRGKPKAAPRVKGRGKSQANSKEVQPPLLPSTGPLGLEEGPTLARGVAGEPRPPLTAKSAGHQPSGSSASPMTQCTEGNDANQVSVSTAKIPRSGQEKPAAEGEGDTRRVKTWSLNTSKFHAMGDVANYIRAFGTTDSYSTQLSERFHRFPKARYRRTNKKQTPFQLSRIQTRQARIKRLRKQLSPPAEEGVPESREGGASYFIGKSQNKPVQIYHFLSINSGDPATKNFLLKLRRHLMPRVVESLLEEARKSPEDYQTRTALPTLQELDRTGLFSDAHFNNIYFHSDRLYRHSIFQVNYTTYDCRRARDTLNPSTSRRHIMCLLPESSEQQPRGSDSPNLDRRRFVYGRILGIFHANIVYGGPGALDHRPRRFDFVWVRWFETRSPDSPNPRPPESSPWPTMRMEQASLKPLSNVEACDFIDPSDVVRGAHIIPRFSEGMMYGDEASIQRRIFSKCAKDKDDWKAYYVNPFVDRDMLMRFHWGMAVGHVYANKAGLRRPNFREGPPKVATGAAIPTEGEPEQAPPKITSQEVTSDDGAYVSGSEDSEYDRPRESDVEFDDRDGGDSERDLPDVQEPESSDQGGDEVYL